VTTKEIHFADLGKGLREIRGDRTLKELGVILGQQISYLCEIENGNKTPSLNMLQRYGRALNTKINLVLGG
tara:strand:+ start:28 stop:240 length:213 start_codon:yes stop_codon:yes gene_type:complete